MNILPVDDLRGVHPDVFVKLVFVKLPSKLGHVTELFTGSL